MYLELVVAIYKRLKKMENREELAKTFLAAIKDGKINPIEWTKLGHDLGLFAENRRKKRKGKRQMLHNYLGKIRPQIFLSLIILGTISVMGIRAEATEIVVGCIAGIIALAKDVLQSDSNGSDGAG